jgi:tRNA dimethylallyltransferase
LSDLDLNSSRIVLVVTGPTAVGKSEIAVEIARQVPSVLISMDSALVYRGMDIGTAKPGPELLQAYPHALVNIRDPANPYSAAEFVRDADALVIQARASQRLPILVGGSMMYLRAFRDGLAELPGADVQIRAGIAREASSRGWAALHQELVEVDPEAAANIHPNNPQRLQRALEVYRITGRPISDFWNAQSDAAFGHRLGGDLRVAGVIPDDRPQLHLRIGERFSQMLEQGLIAEVKALKERGDLSAELPSMRAVGYRQVWGFLEGAFPASQLYERGAAATRQLAKRQLTWLRGWSWVNFFQSGDSRQLATAILRHIQEDPAPRGHLELS